MKIVSVEQMRSIEKSADANGLSYDKMMHNAGNSLAEWIYANLETVKGVVGLIGSGNNGGDTIIALSGLAKLGVRTLGFLVKPRTDDPLLDNYKQLGGGVLDISGMENLDFLRASLIPGTIILDGILGTGLKLPIRSELFNLLHEIKGIVESKLNITVLAIDCPSGLDCDTGEVSKATIKADATLCMAAIKQGLLKHPGRSLVGDIYSMDIGIKDIDVLIEDQLAEMIDEALISTYYPKRPDDGHKGTFGTCFVLAGSPNYAGAAYLAGKAAYESGCGLVRVLTQKTVQQALAGELVEAVWTVLPSSNGAYETEGINKVKAAIRAADSLVIGPGWGLGEENILFLEQLLEIIPNDLPVVIDADGLKLLKQIKDWPRELPENTILTPHPGEMSELTGLSISEIQENRWDYVKKYAVQWKVTLILKGAVTAISTSAGELFVNQISDSALATAGSGDVLTGVIGGLLAQGVKVKETALLGTWLHSLSGKTAHEKIGTDVSVTALDILNALGTGFINRK